jgi:prevent-host-death family protein
VTDVTIRQLRNEGGKVMERVLHGEVLTVTRDGIPVAKLTPIPHRNVPLDVIRERWKNLPPMDYESLRRDLDKILDPSL